MAWLEPRLPSNQFGRAIVSMAAGSLGVQLIGVLASPLTARIFSPSSTGTAMVFANIVTILGAVACLRYELALPLPSERRDRLDVFWLCSLVLLPFIGIVAAVVVLGRRELAAWMGVPALAAYLLLLPLGVLAYTSQNLVTQWKTREREFSDIVKARLHQSAGQVGFQLFVGALTAGNPWVLVTGSIAGNVLCTWRLLHRFLGEALTRLPSVSLRRLWELAAEYRRFPIYNSWSAIADSFTPTIPVFALTALYSTAETGYYRMAQVMVGLPIAAISNSISSVYWGEAGRLVSENPARLLQLYLKLTFRLGAVALLIICGSFILPSLVPVLFGARWAEAGYYARIVAWPAALGLMCVVANNTSLVGRNHWEAIWIVTRIAILLPAVFLCRELRLPAQQTLMVISAILVVGYFALIALNIVALRTYIRKRAPSTAC